MEILKNFFVRKGDIMDFAELLNSTLPDHVPEQNPIDRIVREQREKVDKDKRKAQADFLQRVFEGLSDVEIVGIHKYIKWHTKKSNYIYIKIPGFKTIHIRYKCDMEYKLGYFDIKNSNHRYFHSLKPILLAAKR
jgi:hypothetical protein